MWSSISKKITINGINIILFRINYHTKRNFVLHWSKLEFNVLKFFMRTRWLLQRERVTVFYKAKLINANYYRFDRFCEFFHQLSRFSWHSLKYIYICNIFILFILLLVCIVISLSAGDDLNMTRGLCVQKSSFCCHYGCIKPMKFYLSSKANNAAGKTGEKNK